MSASVTPVSLTGSAAEAVAALSSATSVAFVRVSQSPSAPLPGEDPMLAEAKKRYGEAITVIDSLRQGAKATKDSAKAFKLQSAKTRLTALRLAALVAAGSHDGKRAKGIAEEVASIVRELKALGDQSADVPDGVSSGSDSATAPPRQILGDGSDAEIATLITFAHRILLVARRAVKPGGADWQRINQLLAEATPLLVDSVVVAGTDGGHLDVTA